MKGRTQASKKPLIIFKPRDKKLCSEAGENSISPVAEWKSVLGKSIQEEEVVVGPSSGQMWEAGGYHWAFFLGFDSGG